MSCLVLPDTVLGLAVSRITRSSSQRHFRWLARPRPPGASASRVAGGLDGWRNLNFSQLVRRRRPKNHSILLSHQHAFGGPAYLPTYSPHRTSRNLCCGSPAVRLFSCTSHLAAGSRAVATGRRVRFGGGTRGHQRLVSGGTDRRGTSYLGVCCLGCSVPDYCLLWPVLKLLL